MHALWRWGRGRVCPVFKVSQRRWADVIRIHTSTMAAKNRSPADASAHVTSISLMDRTYSECRLAEKFLLVNFCVGLTPYTMR